MTALPPGPRPRTALDAIPSYAAGGAPRVAPGLVPYKLSSNENPYPPLPGVLEAIAAAAADTHRYPDPAVTDLTAVLARRLDVTEGEIVLGTGSVAVLAHLVQTVCDAGDEVVYAWRSFEAYPIVTAVAGAVAVPVPLRPDGTHDVDAMIAALTPRTRMLLVCSPNNPTGPTVRQDELDRLLDAVPPTVLVVLDDAYVEFVRDPAAADAMAAYRTRPGVALLRTFSKAYGLAGLRVGYALAREPVMTGLRKVATPFGVSRVAQAAAIASLAAEPALLERVESVVVERARARDALLAQGHSVPSAQGNFVWLPLGERSVEFARACEEVALAVRPFPGDGVRVTVAEPEATNRLLEVAARFAP